MWKRNTKNIKENKHAFGFMAHFPSHVLPKKGCPVLSSPGLKYGEYIAKIMRIQTGMPKLNSIKWLQKMKGEEIY